MPNSTCLRATMVIRNYEAYRPITDNFSVELQREINEYRRVFNMPSEEEEAKEKELKLRLYSRRIKTGCKEIDKLLNGGFPTAGITQISGESSCGKTQICLQLSLTAQYPEEMGGLNAGVIYICTEDAFPSKRLSDLCENFPKHLQSPPEDINFSENVFVIHVYDWKQFETCLTEQIPNLLSTRKIGLLIIDSIAGIFRYDCDIPLEQKIKNIDSASRQLEIINVKHNIAVVCVNQVTTQFIDGVGTMVPSLGESWSKYTYTKINLTRSRSETNVVRTFHVTKSIQLPLKSCTFTINHHGIL